MGFIKGCRVTVLRPSLGPPDEMGDPVVDWIPEAVDNVLYQPSASGGTGTSDLGVERPNGDSLTPTFHFPKTFTGSLRGCRIAHGADVYRVVGDPRPLMAENTPGDWDRPVVCEAVDG